MKLILLKDVPKIGHKGDVVTVADGYAANFLVPRKLAVPANEGKIQEAERLKEQYAKEAEEHDQALATLIAGLADISVAIGAKADESGSLFKGIHEPEIAEALKVQHGIELDPGHIIMETPLKHTGDHSVHIESGTKKGTLVVTINRVD